jgi:hypothetical protein
MSIKTFLILWTANNTSLGKPVFLFSHYLIAKTIFSKINPNDSRLQSTVCMHGTTWRRSRVDDRAKAVAIFDKKLLICGVLVSSF